MAYGDNSMYKKSVYNMHAWTKTNPLQFRFLTSNTVCSMNFPKRWTNSQIINDKRIVMVVNLS